MLPDIHLNLSQTSNSTTLRQHLSQCGPPHSSTHLYFPLLSQEATDKTTVRVSFFSFTKVTIIEDIVAGFLSYDFVRTYRSSVSAYTFSLTHSCTPSSFVAFISRANTTPLRRAYIDPPHTTLSHFAPDESLTIFTSTKIPQRGPQYTFGPFAFFPQRTSISSSPSHPESHILPSPARLLPHCYFSLRLT